jgi:ribosomal protein S12 methylthiotransferase accessory factor
MPELADRPFTPLTASLELLEPAVSPFAGIVNAVVRSTHAPDEARIIWASGRLASAQRTIGSSLPEHSGGAHLSEDVARAAALGEALERYSGSYAPIDATILSTAAELGDAAVDPSRFALFHPTQLELPGFPFVEFTRETRLRFVEGFALADGSPAFVPSQLTFMSGWFEDEERIGMATSNGLACGPTIEEAILAGLYELIERDVVMLAWKNRLSLPLLDWSSDEEILTMDRQAFAPAGLRYSVLDGGALFDVPVAIGIVHGPPGEQTALAIGGGAGASVAVAWLKALTEAFGVRRWLAVHTLDDPDRAPADPRAVTTFEDHMLFYARHGEAALAHFLDGSVQRTPTTEVPVVEGTTPRAQILELVRRLAQKGCSAYVVDITAPDVATLGVHVVRVISPELCQLDVVHAARFLGGRRLYRAAFEAGVAARPFELDDLNDLPHPFP